MIGGQISTTYEGAKTAIGGGLSKLGNGLQQTVQAAGQTLASVGGELTLFPIAGWVGDENPLRPGNLMVGLQPWRPWARPLIVPGESDPMRPLPGRPSPSIEPPGKAFMSYGPFLRFEIVIPMRKVKVQ